MKKLMVILAATSTLSAFAGGFALNQASAKATAMGGAVTGKAVDGSAVFYNPATMSDLKSTTVTLGTIVEKPYADVSVNGKAQGHMDPGWFLLPHAYLVQPIGESGFTFGMGIAPEFGIGSKYRNNWDLAWNTTETTVEGLSISPNLAYDITEDWSVAAGFRLLYLSFEQKQSPIVNQHGLDLGQANAHLKGDNNWSDWGWEVSTRYKILDNLSIGAMYRSYVDTRVRGKIRTRAKSMNAANINKLADGAVVQAVGGLENYQQMMLGAPDQLSAIKAQAVSSIQSQLATGVAAANGDAGADVRLPQSVSVGINWDATETVHLGYTMMWTGWNDLEDLTFDLPYAQRKNVHLGWRDTFRFGVGGAWDFAEDWTWMLSYVYDMDPSSEDPNQGSTMLPAGNRHMACTGLAYTWGDLEIAAVYGMVFMKGENQKYWRTDEYGAQISPAQTFSTSAGYSHQAGITLTYRF